MSLVDGLSSYSKSVSIKLMLRLLGHLLNLPTSRYIHINSLSKAGWPKSNVRLGLNDLIFDIPTVANSLELLFLPIRSSLLVIRQHYFVDCSLLN